MKSRIALEILKEEKTLNELSSEHGIHVNQLRQWKKTVLEQLPNLFAREGKELDKIKSGYEKQLEDLYAEIGRLTTQLSWLKKKIWPLGVGKNGSLYSIGRTRNCQLRPKLNSFI
jgi:transposase-like protein